MDDWSLMACPAAAFIISLSTSRSLNYSLQVLSQHYGATYEVAYDRSDPSSSCQSNPFMDICRISYSMKCSLKIQILKLSS